MGLATGYYLGAKAGRERYVQINRALRGMRQSTAFGAATDKAKAMVDLGVERAKDIVDLRHPADQQEVILLTDGPSSN
jgi:hypothetical protein